MDGAVSMTGKVSRWELFTEKGVNSWYKCSQYKDVMKPKCPSGKDIFVCDKTFNCGPSQNVTALEIHACLT